MDLLKIIMFLTLLVTIKMELMVIINKYDIIIFNKYKKNFKFCFNFSNLKTKINFNLLIENLIVYTFNLFYILIIISN